MIIYLAARYSRRLELCGYRDQLRALGHEVPARWLNGAHQISTDGMPLTEEGERKFEEGHPDADALRAGFARDDLDDVLAANLVVAFTEQPRSGAGSSRGGRHVELGVAIGTGKRIAVVGPRENIFCWLPHIWHYPGWPSFLEHLDNRCWDLTAPAPGARLP